MSEMYGWVTFEVSAIESKEYQFVYWLSYNYENEYQLINYHFKYQSLNWILINQLPTELLV